MEDTQEGTATTTYRNARWVVPLLLVACSVDTILICLATPHGQFAGEFPIATIAALFLMALSCPARCTWLCFWVSALLQGSTLEAVAHMRLGHILLHTNWLLLAVVLGRLLEDRRARTQHAQEMVDMARQHTWNEATAAMTTERVRIAGDLHDVLAHHIAVVNAQAGVANYLLDRNPDAARTALQGIEENSRKALDDLRATISILRAEQPPMGKPLGADHIQDLIDTLQPVMTVTFQETGQRRPLAPIVDTAVYRITQEALTNASKHAPHEPVHMSLHWQHNNLHLEVLNQLPALDPHAPGTRHGLLGMQERARAAHAELFTGPKANQWVVEFTCPLTPENPKDHR